MPAASDAPSQEAPDSRKAPDLRGGVPHEETPLEEATRKKLGLQRWDRPALFRETAEAAVDTDLPFWLVLLLSGAIATLGLLLNQTAVVIGAMLVAPLLGPLLGLSLALAIGDGRLAAHTFLTILCGMLGVIAVAAGLTLVLPFTEVTSEIAARTRPTTLDLAIAIFSGLAGAIVTVSRERRLSASIPGVAIAVALIPPLGVSGFGLATGQWALVKGSLLLFGANLGGIVIMGMLAFLAVGMHRDDVREAARKWHDMETEDTFGARIASLPGMNRLGVLRSPLARVALVGAFVAAVAIPLSSSLEQVLREGRVKQAVAMAVNRLEADDEASVLTREIEFGERSTSAALRIATTAWISDEERRTVEAEASDAAGEPVALRLEQVLASRGDIQALADQLPTDPTPAPAPEASGAPPSLDAVRARVADVLAGMAVPDSVALVGGEIGVGDGPPALTVLYAASRRLSPDAEQLLARQAALAFGVPPEAARTRSVRLGTRAVPADSASAARLASDLGALVGRYASLRLVVRADSASGARLRQGLVRAGAPEAQVSVRRDSVPARITLRLAS